MSWMATENKSEQYPQPSALQENPPEPFPDGSGSGSSARDGPLEPAKQSSPEHSETQPTTNTSQERGRGSDSDPEPSRPPLFPEDDGDGNDAASEISIPSDHNDAAASQQGVIPPSASVPPPYWTNPRLLERQKQQQQNGKHLRPPHTTATTTASSSSLSSPSGHLLGNGHARTVSNASAESVLPPGAITLQDNEQEEEEEEEEEEAGVRGEGINGNGARANGHASTVGAVGTVPGGGGRRRSSDRHGRERNRACWARSVQVTDYVLVNGSTTNIGAFVVWIIKVETLNGSRMNIRKRYSEFDDLRRRLVQAFPGFEAAVPALPPKSVLKRFQPRFLEKRRAGLQYFLNCILLNPEFSGSPVLKDFLFS